MSKITYFYLLPSCKKMGKSKEEIFLVYDRRLLKSSSTIKQWILKFPNNYPVTAGESLKDLDEFPKHIKQIQKKTEKINSKGMSIVALGGGSVGDFAGFVASVFQRGVGLIHIPSTWLAAIDSSHGGKTALNVNGVKNQLGSFYPANDVFLIKPLLFSQGKDLAVDAASEIIKMSLIKGGAFWREIYGKKIVRHQELWSFLPQAIESKYEVVRKDPKEEKGIRQVLNLGHTLGHVLESHYLMSHGRAVMHGLYFSLNWSLQKKLMLPKTYDEIIDWLGEENYLKPIRREKALKLLIQDKKRVSKKSVKFIFLKKPGKTVIKEVSYDEVIVEACRQGRCI